jgi:hypothetical protein
MSAPSANRGRFHPPPRVWTNGPVVGQHHGVEAQRNLDACVSCHSERDCVSCHATPSAGGTGWVGRNGDLRGLNPHPPGFSSRCATALRKNARPCLVCHHPADPTLEMCR